MSGSRAKSAGRSKRPLVIALVAVVLVAVVAAVVLLTRGGGDAGAATKPEGPGGLQMDRYPVPDVKDLDRDKAKREQTKLTACDALEQGGWQAMGTVENSGDEPKDYDITVFFMNGDDEPVNFAQTKVTAPADGTVPWVVEKVFGTDDDLTCKIVAVG